ncbi:hypothetical protein ILUMI_15295, partial [Ignelater luminosus]
MIRIRVMSTKSFVVVGYPVSTRKRYYLASYRVAYRVAKTGKLHIVAENLILPAAMNMVEIRLSKQEIVEKLKKSPHFALQFDESTDVTDCPQFVVLVRFEADRSIIEDILFRKALSANTTGQCMYDLFLESTRDYEIDWTKCIVICSSGAKAMTGNKSGLVAKLKSIMPNFTWIHCFLYRSALASKVLPSDLNDVLKEVIKVVK